MIHFLEKLQGTHVKSTEKTELTNLRKEMDKYRKLNLKHSIKEEFVESDPESDNEITEEEQRAFEEKMINKMKNQNQRASVSAEAYGVYNKKEDFKVKIIKKSPEVKEKIWERVKASFLFNNLDEKDLTTVIDAMGERRVKYKLIKFRAGERVITQGENGDDLYIVESGVLKCFKEFVYFRLIIRIKKKERNISETILKGKLSEN